VRGIGFPAIPSEHHDGKQQALLDQKDRLLIDGFRTRYAGERICKRDRCRKWEGARKEKGWGRVPKNVTAERVRLVR